MSGADRADLPKSPPDFRILRGKTNEFMIRIYEATEPSDLLAEAFARLLPQLSERMTAPDREAVARIVASPATRQLVAAAEDGRIVGLLREIGRAQLQSVDNLLQHCRSNGLFNIGILYGRTGNGRLEHVVQAWENNGLHLSVTIL